MDTVSGIFRYLDFIFRMDQKRFGFDLSSGSIATKNESRLSRILRLISERKSLNLFLKLLDGNRFNFRLIDSFFFIRSIIGPLIQGIELFFFSFF